MFMVRPTQEQGIKSFLFVNITLEALYIQIHRVHENIDKMTNLTSEYSEYNTLLLWYFSWCFVLFHRSSLIVWILAWVGWSMFGKLMEKK